jgi:AraC-like DNA-binding protein
MIGALYAGTKLYFGMGSDVGGYIIATYISFMFFVTTYQVMDKSEHFSTSNSFLDFPIVKYKKSSLTEPDKARIQDKLKIAMERDLFFKNNLASLSKLAKIINESQHHVSQVINEKYDKSFFELIAFYRIEEAKKIIIGDIEREITIEELADQVGYNSKSSFNSAFKKYTHQTPSEFRRLSHEN